MTTILDIVTMVIILFFLYLFYREWAYNRRLIRNREINEEQKRKEQIDIQGIFDNLPRIISETERLYEEQKRAHATPEVLKPLEERLGQLRWVQQNEWLLRRLVPVAERWLRRITEWF